jgi:hypothetical protein
MVLISAIDNYSKHVIEPLVTSVNNVQFTGTKIMIVYYDGDGVSQYLRQNGWIVINRQIHTIVHIQRFIDAHDILKQYPNESYLLFDGRDVVFNGNPQHWDLHTSLYIGADGLFNLSDHWWGKENMIKSYPQYYDLLKDKYHLNCGVIYGEGDIMIELLLDVYNMALQSNQRINIEPRSFTPDDQMGLNVLCYTKYKDVVKVQSPSHNYFIHMIQTPTHINGNKPYYIYHQYDKVEGFDLSNIPSI